MWALKVKKIKIIKVANPVIQIIKSILTKHTLQTVDHVTEGNTQVTPRGVTWALP